MTFRHQLAMLRPMLLSAISLAFSRELASRVPGTVIVKQKETLPLATS